MYQICKEVNLDILATSLGSEFLFFLFQAFGMNDVIGCFLNLDQNEIRWSKNGEFYL